MLLLAHAAQEMPEWERWEISRGKERERNMSWETLSPKYLFWQDPPCVRGQFPRLVCWIRKPELSTRGDPVSTHISIWTFSHSEVQFFRRGVLFFVRNSTQVFGTSPLLMRWAIISGSTPSLLGFPESNLLVHNRIGKRSEDRVRQPDLAAAF